MKEQAEAYADLKEIRGILDRHTRVLSLSGLSGVLIGLIAIVGAGLFYAYLKRYGFDYYIGERVAHVPRYVVSYFLMDASIVMLASLGVSYFLSVRNAKRAGQPFWNVGSRRMVIQLAIPLVVGGFFILALYQNNLLYLVSPCTLIFYGLALINAGKYAVTEVHKLGLAQCALGLASLFWIEYNFVLWVIGFGLLHIVYGLLMYMKYERKPAKSSTTSNKNS